MIEDINKEPNLLLLYNSIFKINKIKEDYEGILSIKAELQHSSPEDINQYKNDIDTLNSLDNVVDSIEKSLISALKSSHGLICDIEGIHNTDEDGKSTANFLGFGKNQTEKDLIKLSKLPDKMTDEKFIKKTELRCKILEDITTRFMTLNGEYLETMKKLSKEIATPSKKGIFPKLKNKKDKLIDKILKILNNIKTLIEILLVKDESKQRRLNCTYRKK